MTFPLNRFLRLAVVAMAGLAAEGLQYDKVVGQSADLFTLQVCSHFHFTITTLSINFDL